MKRILIFILSIISIRSETNLFIFSGCENEKKFASTHSSLIYALNSDSSPVLVSGSILRHTLETFCDKDDCENLLESNLIIDKFDVYYLDFYFLFIPKDKLHDFQKIFNLNSMQKIDLEKSTDLEFSKTKVCMASDSPSYLTENLLNKIFQKTDVEFNIYLGGHGYFYKDSRLLLENLAHVNYLNRDFGIILDNLSQTQLEKLRQDLDHLKQTSGQDFTELLRNISEKYNLDFANVSENNVSEIIQYIESQLDIFGKLDAFFEDKLNVIAGIPLKEFRKILDFLNNNINTKLLYILSCFSGGLNSILPYMDAKINLKQNRYKFDIVSLSNTEYSYINLQKSYVDIKLVISEITIDIFNAIAKNQKLESKYNEIIKKFEIKNLITFSSPIIRRKNSIEWFPLFPQIRLPQFNFYTITSLLNNVYRNESRVFEIKSPGIALVTTQCITSPIELSINDQILIRNLPEIYIKELKISNPEEIAKRYKREIKFLKSQYSTNWSVILILNMFFNIFPIVPPNGILIENLVIGSLSLKNIIFNKSDNKMMIIYNAPHGNFKLTAQFGENMELEKVYQQTLSSSKFNKRKTEILKKCPQMNLFEIIEFLKKHSAGL